MKISDKQIFVFFALLLSGVLGFIVSLYLHGGSFSRAPSSVQTIQTFHYPALFVKQLKGDPRAGEKVFKEFCSACHAKEPTIDVHAPLVSDTKTWQYRAKMGMPTLLKITINGKGAMPARGGCFECSDDQLRQTIQYILDQAK
jgi:cytochrome c5